MGDGCQKGVMDAKKGCQGIWEKQRIVKMKWKEKVYLGQ
jgi:hypothetical protein